MIIIPFYSPILQTFSKCELNMVFYIFYAIKVEAIIARREGGWGTGEKGEGIKKHKLVVTA